MLGGLPMQSKIDGLRETYKVGIYRPALQWSSGHVFWLLSISEQQLPTVLVKISEKFTKAPGLIRNTTIPYFRFDFFFNEQDFTILEKLMGQYIKIKV